MARVLLRVEVSLPGPAVPSLTAEIELNLYRGVVAVRWFCSGHPSGLTRSKETVARVDTVDVFDNGRDAVVLDLYCATVSGGGFRMWIRLPRNLIPGGGRARSAFGLIDRDCQLSLGHSVEIEEYVELDEEAGSLIAAMLALRKR
mgnify:CR=1 FL=1